MDSFNGSLADLPIEKELSESINKNMRVPRSLSLRENVDLDDQVPNPSADLEMHAPRMIAPYEDEENGAGTELDHPVGLTSASMVWESGYDFLDADEYSMKAPARNIRADSLVVEEFLDQMQDINLSFQEMPQPCPQEIVPDPSARMLREQTSTPNPIMTPRYLGADKNII